MRQRHADKLERVVGIAMPDIEFPEIDEVVQHIASTDIPPEQSYVLVPPREKIQKNRLSSRWVMMGLSQAGAVGRYMDRHLDAESSRRLRAGFVKRYEELRGEGLDGDDLFMALWLFASRGKADPKMQAAGLALLVYLFEKCEVFERRYCQTSTYDCPARSWEQEPRCWNCLGVGERLAACGLRQGSGGRSARSRDSR